ncbi:MAG: hypothetical protein LBB65_05665, partial [Burkholderiales bacterium]|jgi:hypothetical protein|nr:hypothetical protein [Burkholderiales bacterium]
VVSKAGLNHLVAVIQHSYHADKVDMYFDLPLWESLLKFAFAFDRTRKFASLNTIKTGCGNA